MDNTKDLNFTRARKAVWWDFKTCKTNLDRLKTVCYNIRHKLVQLGYRGPLSIFAFCELEELTNEIRDALQDCGIHINAVPKGGNVSIKLRMVINMLSWSRSNRVPAIHFVISGDVGLARTLAELRNRKHKILLAQDGDAGSMLREFAETCLEFKNLATGNVLPRKFEDFAQSSNLGGNL